MKFYILTSSKIESLMKHSETIPLAEQVVIINTLDDDYLISATEYCIQNNIEHYVTESDGTPATGKNSVMQKFLESEYEYMVQVDCDDTITKEGYEYYKRVSENNPPDLICLYNQWLERIDAFDVIDGVEVPVNNLRTFGWRRHIGDNKRRFHRFNLLKWYRTLKEPRHKGDVYVWRGKIEDERLKSWANSRQEWETICQRHGVGQTNSRIYDCFNRMVFYSRKAASLVKFDKKLLIGEDTMAFWEMKKHYGDGKIRLHKHDESNLCTYLYNNIDDGVVMSSSNENDVITYDWIVDLLRYVKGRHLEERYREYEHIYVKECAI